MAKDEAVVTTKKIATRMTSISCFRYHTMPVILGCCFLLVATVIQGGVINVSAQNYDQQSYSSDTNASFLSYYDPTTGISMQYPAHWQSFAVTPPVAAAFGNPQSYSGLTVTVFAPATSADAEIQNLINSHSVTTPGFQLVSSGVGEITRMPAPTIFFNFIDPAGYQAAAIQSLVTTPNGIGYIVTYMFYPSITDSGEISDIRTMVTSLEVNDAVLMYNANYMNSGSGGVSSDQQQEQLQPPITDTRGSSLENPANRATDEIIDESLGGYAGGVELDGEIHRWDGTQGNIYGDTSGDP